MANKSEFINYLYQQVEVKSIYCWGAQGQLLTGINPSWIERHETSKSNASKVIKMYEERKGIKGCRAFDCSGLGMYWLQNLKKVFSGDLTANGLKGKCAKISKSSAKAGDFVFKVNVSGKATHIGYVVDDGYVVEAQGRAYGVVKRKMSAGGWNWYGRPAIWDAEPYHLKRVLKKGDEGDDVAEVQKRLISLGYSCGSEGADGIFGSKTKTAVKSFQKKNKDYNGKRLEVDGIVGEKTCIALGFEWK